MDKAAELKARYGKRIQEIMMVPIVEDIYRKYKGTEAEVLALVTKAKTETIKAEEYKLQTSKNCPLMQ